MSTTLSAPADRPSRLQVSGWDSRVFVLAGDNREHLRERAAALARFIEQAPDTDSAGLAATLAGQVREGGVRLAIVAASTSDLLARLHRAGERLGNASCTLIRDAAGTYFSSQPLFPQGQLGLLFPGEGAQYPGMLQDLCGVFPEVEETFAWCDQLAAQFDRPEGSLRDILHLSPDATLDERKAAEARLRQLGPSIFGVLVADLAISRVLLNLDLPVAAVAGHSAGEMSALVFAGVMKDDDFVGSKLSGIIDLMQKQEDESGGPEVCLLAIGAGKTVVLEIARSVAGDSVFIAMDNCPHQCVAVGPASEVARVEAALLERGLVCERLPFRRPYHTPLFEPWMEPYRQLFATAPFESPRVPVYCCSTGARFPADADAIRQLTVNHWVSPVEFTRMVDAMYADGVRIFVEAGPRGNLSAFAEDILRGRQFAAIPANLPRKSGPTQINHLAAQLLVQQVPFNLNHLFKDLEFEPVDWEGPSAVHRETETAAGPEPLSASVMNGYLSVMEQFLDVQRSVMETYLAGGNSYNSPQALADVSFADFETLLATGAAPHEPGQYALVGRIEQLEPGRSIVVRRTLDEREDLFADHHTLAGRNVSKIDPGQNGLPVLPMTFSIEGMAEAALLLVPGKVVIAVRNIRLHRWIPYDPDPTTLEIRAAILTPSTETGVVEVKADVRDLGNSFLKDGANKVAAEAVIVLADRYPDPPEPRAFALTEEAQCRSTVEDLRRNMFHGPIFQMLNHLGRIGKEGIEGTLEVLSRSTWFRSMPEPRIVIDPVLLDSAMHILGAWHLEQPDWTGRILLPFEVQKIEYFGPTPEVGRQLLTRGHNEQESARHFRHGLEVFDDEGRLWLRVTGGGYWRFYLPFGHVNFFGPKDEYYLSRDWPQAVSSDLPGPKNCRYLDPPVDLKQPVLRAAGSRVTMTPREQAEFRAWSGTDEELNDWFFGRLVAKDAIRAAWMQKYGEATFPADMESAEIAGRIVCKPRGEARAEPYPAVAVAIAGGRIAAFAAFASNVGIALLPLAREESETAARARAACLAAADALQYPVDNFRPARVDPASGVHEIAIPDALRQRYPALAGGILRAQTACDKNFVVATTMFEAAQA